MISQCMNSYPTLEMILEVDMVETEVEDNILIARIITGLATPMIVSTSYMVDLQALLTWLNLLILLGLRLKV